MRNKADLARNRERVGAAVVNVVNGSSTEISGLIFSVNSPFNLRAILPGKFFQN